MALHLAKPRQPSRRPRLGTRWRSVKLRWLQMERQQTEPHARQAERLRQLRSLQSARPRGWERSRLEPEPRPSRLAGGGRRRRHQRRQIGGAVAISHQRNVEAVERDRAEMEHAGERLEVIEIGGRPLESDERSVRRYRALARSSSEACPLTRITGPAAACTKFTWIKADSDPCGILIGNFTGRIRDIGREIKAVDA